MNLTEQTPYTRTRSSQGSHKIVVQIHINTMQWTSLPGSTVRRNTRGSFLRHRGFQVVFISLFSKKIFFSCITRKSVIPRQKGKKFLGEDSWRKCVWCLCSSKHESKKHVSRVSVLVLFVSIWLGTPNLLSTSVLRSTPAPNILFLMDWVWCPGPCRE